MGQKVLDLQHQSHQAHSQKWKHGHDMGTSVTFGLLVGSPNLLVQQTMPFELLMYIYNTPPSPQNLYLKREAQNGTEWA
jgi:hypothetical protein